MAAFGGLSPYPRRCGGGTPRLQAILGSINGAMGTAYDTTQTSKVYARNMALARCINAGWATNQRLANQWDPARMSSSLARWEKILALLSDPLDTMADRRARVTKAFQDIGRSPTHQQIVDDLVVVLGDVFVAVEYISFANAVIHVPDGTYPWGTVAAGSPWYSTIAHILIRTQKPADYSEGDFYVAVGRVHEVLDPLVPAWATWDWYRPGPISANVVGGPSAGGFYLDDEHNLDNEVFDV